MAGPEELGTSVGITPQYTEQQMRKLTDLRARTREYSQDLRVLGNAGRDTGEILARAFTSAAVKGKDLSSTFKSLILSLSQKTLRSAASSFQGVLTSGLQGLFSGAMRNANGNAIAQGRVIPLARGGVVNSPTLFPLSGGATGLMGEAGPEAVMPLTRGADGRLGVRAGENAGARIVSINFNVTTPDAEGMRRSEGQIAAMLQRVAERGGRNL